MDRYAATRPPTKHITGLSGRLLSVRPRRDRNPERTLVASPSDTISIFKDSSKTGASGSRHTDTSERPSRARTMSSGTLMSFQSTISTFSMASGHKDGCCTHLKTPPLSEVDLEVQHMPPVHAPLRSAQTSLRLVVGVQKKERPPLTPSAAQARHMVSDHPTNSVLSPGHTTRNPPRALPIASRIIRRSSSPDSLSTASSSEAPATPRTHSPLLDESRPTSTLEDLEQASRFRVNAVCVTCRKKGSNFPSCSSCGEMWCSRECRLKSNGGRGHLCSRRTGASTSHIIFPGFALVPSYIASFGVQARIVYTTPIVVSLAIASVDSNTQDTRDPQSSDIGVISGPLEMTCQSFVPVSLSVELELEHLDTQTSQTFATRVCSEHSVAKFGRRIAASWRVVDRRAVPYSDCQPGTYGKYSFVISLTGDTGSRTTSHCPVLPRDVSSSSLPAADWSTLLSSGVRPLPVEFGTPSAEGQTCDSSCNLLCQSVASPRSETRSRLRTRPNQNTGHSSQRFALQFSGHREP
ncbi:hypothetical protein CERSUDRAFT_122092 [Gelatoporia subvermispora B]|uniref:Uncharacterized protein n=1 Tax=Ceriporiopsis subvermispora (strain B) TaxID=914234 RepID=M2R5X4_CERS8|nr:hypothetical protein CERSUDRAFT_122092 [Gelatoporia subvermispora B]